MVLNMPLVRSSMTVAEVRRAPAAATRTDTGGGAGVGRLCICSLLSPLDSILEARAMILSQMAPNSACNFTLALAVSTIAALFTDLRERQNRSVELQYGANSAARCCE
jgi:hypothetical protein